MVHQKKNQKIEFRNFIKEMRSKLKLTSEDIENASRKLSKDKDYQIAGSYISIMENGRGIPSAKKIHTMAQIFGVDSNKMLYLAGHLNEEPDSRPADWDRDISRKYYVRSFYPSDREPHDMSIEELAVVTKDALKDLIDTSPVSHSSKLKKNNDQLGMILRDIFIDYLSSAPGKKPLNEKQKDNISRIIEDYLEMLSQE